MNSNRDYYNYAIRHLETLNSVIHQMETINGNLYNLYRRPSTSSGVSRPYGSRRNTNLNTNTALDRTTLPTPVTNTNDNLNNIANNVLTSLFFEPVPIYPTQIQIDRATSAVSFADLPTDTTTCPISMQPFNETSEILRINHCGHVFSRPSIMRWFRNHVSCPVCRHDIRQSEENLNNNNQDASSTTNAERQPAQAQTFQFDLNLDTTPIYNALLNSNNRASNTSTTDFYSLPLPPRNTTSGTNTTNTTNTTTRPRTRYSSRNDDNTY